MIFINWNYNDRGENIASVGNFMVGFVTLNIDTEKYIAKTNWPVEVSASEHDDELAAKDAIEEIVMRYVQDLRIRRRAS